MNLKPGKELPEGLKPTDRNARTALDIVWSYVKELPESGRRSLSPVIAGHAAESPAVASLLGLFESNQHTENAARHQVLTVVPPAFHAPSHARRLGEDSARQQCTPPRRRHPLAGGVECLEQHRTGGLRAAVQFAQFGRAKRLRVWLWTLRMRKVKP